MTDRTARRIIFLTAVAIAAMAVPSRAQISPPTELKIVFTGIVGEKAEGDPWVLLRWYQVEGPMPFETFRVYRKPGDENAPNDLFELITEIGKIRNINTVRSIFEQPGAEEAVADVKDILTDITEAEITNNNYAQHLIEVLEGGCEACGFQTETFAALNWGVALVEGLGYVDDVPPGVYTYELHAVDGGGTALPIGKITIDANEVTQLPAPVNAQEVVIPGARGDRTAFLKWDIPPDLQSAMPLAFGYNIYRYEGNAPNPGDFLTLLQAGQLEKVNDRPVVILSPELMGIDPSESYFFADDGREIAKGGPVGARFVPSQTFTYWAAARDLFGQRGQESNPVVVTIRDQFPPRVPKNPKTRVIRVGSEWRIMLQWDRNPDDTQSYNICRYQHYDNTGFPGPFPPEGGLTEGLVSSVAQPATGESVRLVDLDLTEDLVADRIFWYCLSAVDDWGNESGLSQPVRGVLQDTRAPDPPRVECIWRRLPSCGPLFDPLKSEVGVGRLNVADFRIKDVHSGVLEVTIVRTIPGEDPVEVYAGPIVADGSFEVSDAYDPGLNPTNPTWTFTFVGADGNVCSEQDFQDASGAMATRGGHIVVGVSVGAGIIDPVCGDDAPGRVPHHPEVGGILIPLCIPAVGGGDAVGAILYRAHDCAQYEPIDIKYFNGMGMVDLCDYFHPVTDSIACYAVRSFDANYNLSSLRYLQTQVIFVGSGSPLVPAVQRVTPMGTPGDPLVQVDWFGPKQGVAGYIISTATKGANTALDFFVNPGEEQEESKRMESRWLTSELSYNEEVSVWSVIIRYLDEDTSTPITPNIPYEVKVIALDESLNRTPSANEKEFVWTDIPPPMEFLDWPVRGLPIHFPYPIVPFFDAEPELAPDRGGVWIRVGHMVDTGSGRITIEDRLFTPRPFVFYRQRLDIPDQPWVQISPLFESLNTSPDGITLIDPFFVDLVYDGIFFVDNTVLVAKARYQYQLIIYEDPNGEENQGELKYVFGPSETVDITFP